jgi:hypothetical protein
MLQPFSKLPVPSWQLGQSVALDEFKRVTDTYFKALEPARKLKTQQLPAQVSKTLRWGLRGRGNWLHRVARPRRVYMAALVC